MGHLPVDLFWYRTQYLFPLLWTPFALCFRQWTIAYPLETSYCTVLLCSRCVSFVKLERYSYVHSWDTPRWISLITSYHCRAAPYLFVSTMEFPEERTTTSSWCFGIKNWRHQRKGLTSARRSIRITRTFPLTPLLNLGTRFLVVDENCDARISKLQ